MKTIYLAGGITGHSYAAATEWRLHVEACLGNRYHILDPMRDKGVLQGALTIEVEQSDPSLTPEKIFERDIADIDAADLLLVRLDTAKSVGTPWEMGYAYAKGKPVIAVAPIDLFQHPFVKCPSEAVFSCLDDAINYLILRGEG